MRCLRCHSSKLWKLGSGKRRCATCRYTFVIHVPGFHLSVRMAKRITEEFILEHSSNIILTRYQISKATLLKFLTQCRVVMTIDVPKVFSGSVEVDETYVGGQWKNKRKSEKKRYHPRGRGTLKQPVFGILCRQGYVFAELVKRLEANDLQPRIEKQVVKGSTIYSDHWRGYTGIAARGYVHRLVDHASGIYSDYKGGHINGLEGFWGYLKRKLAAKGGVRRSRLHLYVGEYVWRYNHRKQSIKQKTQRLITLLMNNH